MMAGFGEKYVAWLEYRGLKVNVQKKRFYYA